MRFIHPPRPISRINPDNLAKYEVTPWTGQRKFNGTRNVIHLGSDGTAEVFTKGGEQHKQWELSPEVKDQLFSLDLNPKFDYWLDSELLHRKTATPHYKNRIVLFDIMFAGKYFFNGPTTAERYDILKSICRDPKELESENGIALAVTENVWLAETFPHTELVTEYSRYLEKPEIEGLVLKKANARIENLGRKKYEVSWLVRCRKPHKNYTF